MHQPTSEIDQLAKTIWNYSLMQHPLEPADAIMILGTHDPNVANYGIELFKQNWAPWLIISGGVKHPPEVFKADHSMTEAEFFFQKALEQGVLADRIIVENEAKNTGENFFLTKRLLKRLGHDFYKFIVVQKPYSERRSYATGKKQWPNKTLIMASTPVTYEDYIKSGIPKERIINTMVGALQRIKLYPAKGYQIPQHIPPEVWEAGERLIKLGFDKRLVR